MATRESNAARGTRRGDAIATRLRAELRSARIVADVSMRTIAVSLGWSLTAYRRFESGESRTTFVDVSAVAALLGLELGAGLHPAGDPIRDKGHQALIARFREVLGASWRVAREVPFPSPGDARTWDLVLRM